MRILDRHLFLEWAKAFLLAIAATYGILLLEDLYRNLGDFMDYGAESGTILRYYYYTLPTLLPLVLPVSLLISVLFALGNLHRHNEIVAMRASGIGLIRMGLPLWCVGIAAAAILFILNAKIVPQSVEQSRQINNNLRFAGQAEQTSIEWVGHIPLLAFANKAENRMWFMNRFSEYTYRAYGITVHQLDEAGMERERIMAREGYFDDVTGYWVFNNGRHMTFDGEGTPNRSRYFETMEREDLQESPDLMLTLRKRPIDLSLGELNEVLYALGEDNPQLRAHEVRRQSILVSPVNCLLAVLIGVPFAVSGVRSNPMVGVARASALFFGYFLLASISKLLGEQGILSVTTAAWLPAAVALLAAGYFVCRSR